MSNDFTAGLLRRGLITEEKLEWAREHAAWADQALPETLIWYGLATRREVMSALHDTKLQSQVMPVDVGQVSNLIGSVR